MKSPPTKKRFSLLRFSLRFLLLVVFVVACVLGWISWQIQAAKAELQLARKLEAAGSIITWNHLEGDERVMPEPGWNYNWLRYQWTSHVDSLTLIDQEITSLESLKPFKRLTELSLNCSMLADIDAITQFPDLKTLELSNSEHLKDLHAITSLQQLNTLQINTCAGLSKAAVQSASAADSRR